jgi:hypothetical protein
MSTADQKVDQAADKVKDLADRMAGEEGMKAKLADPLAEDADLIRRMKPSLIKARMHGEAPTDQKPGETTIPPSPKQPRSRPAPEKQRRRGGGPNPWAVVGAALVAGILIAKWIDWRGHAHPRY